MNGTVKEFKETLEEMRGIYPFKMKTQEFAQ